MRGKGIAPHEFVFWRASESTVFSFRSMGAWRAIRSCEKAFAPNTVIAARHRVLIMGNFIRFCLYFGVVTPVRNRVY